MAGVQRLSVFIIIDKAPITRLFNSDQVNGQVFCRARRQCTWINLQCLLSSWWLLSVTGVRAHLFLSSPDHIDHHHNSFIVIITITGIVNVSLIKFKHQHSRARVVRGT